MTRFLPRSPGFFLPDREANLLLTPDDRKGDRPVKGVLREQTVEIVHGGDGLTVHGHEQVPLLQSPPLGRPLGVNAMTQGIGLAIPANTAPWVVPASLLNYGF